MNIKMTQLGKTALLLLLLLAYPVAAQQPSLKITPQMELQLTGQTGNYYRVESSANLADWVPQGSYFQLLSVPYTQTVGGAGERQEFFRARALPSDWKVMNNSYPDTCAEHDNVNVAFRGNVTNFSIIATHPTNYLVTDYTCAANFTNCLPDTGTNYTFPYAMWDIGYGLGYLGGWAKAYRESSFWRPQGMTVSLNGVPLVTGTATNIHRIDIGRQIAVGNGESPGYFVLYSDGYMRLIPFPPAGHPDVCFGSSVIIGPAAIAKRPYADIESADLRTPSQTLFVVYRSGGTATIDFSDVTRTRTVVRVTVDYPTDQSFCTFRSMYVSDGDSDCDHVVWQTNGATTTNSIMSFSGTTGTNWFFNRRTISSQRQSAPDIRIILK